MTGIVWAGGPVKGATVHAVQWIEGNPIPVPFGSAVTDEDGAFRIENTPPVWGLIEVVASGGTYREPWGQSSDLGSDLDGDPALGPFGDIELDIELRAAVPCVALGVYELEVVVSPFTTLAARMATRHLENDPELPRESTFHRVNEHFNAHLAGSSLPSGELDLSNTYFDRCSGVSDVEPPARFDLVRTMPASLASPATSLGRAEKQALVTAGLSFMAVRAAEAQGREIGSINTIEIIRLLLRDLEDDLVRFDGVGPGAESLEFPDCPMDCGSAPDRGECSQPCRLSSSTLRAELARSIIFGFVPSHYNATGFDYVHVLPWSEKLLDTHDVLLFGEGGDPQWVLDSQAPVVKLLDPYLRDESRDQFAFGPNVRPRPVPSIPDGALVDVSLDGPVLCPEVARYGYKFFDGEPVRLGIQLIDRESGPGPLWYRVRIDEEFVGSWRQARVVGTPGQEASWRRLYPRIVDYEIAFPDMASGSEIDAQLASILATRPATVLVEFEAGDIFSPAIRPRSVLCWKHTPLPPPLWVSQPVVATGPDSLHAANLDESPDNPTGSNLAELINGDASLHDGLALFEFDVQNGTAMDGYLTFEWDQPEAYFVKSWRLSNVRVEPLADPTSCVRRDQGGDCYVKWESGIATHMHTGISEPLDGLVTGIQIEDITPGQRPTQGSAQEFWDPETPGILAPCPKCDANEFRIGPRITEEQPRIYRVKVVVSDLGFLAPVAEGESVNLPFSDVKLVYGWDPGKEPESLVITGLLHQRFDVCGDYDAMSGTCQSAATYQRYRALSDVEIALTSAIRVTGHISPSPDLPPQIVPYAGPGQLDEPLVFGPGQPWVMKESALPQPVPWTPAPSQPD